MTDEVWTMRDGTTIAVGDMDEGHVRNALRMVLRKARRATEKRDRLAAMTRRVMEEAYADVDPQDILHAQAMRDLSNPNCFFPLLEGGVHGSPDLAKRHTRW